MRRISNSEFQSLGIAIKPFLKYNQDHLNLLKEIRQKKFFFMSDFISSVSQINWMIDFQSLMNKMSVDFLFFGHGFFRFTLRLVFVCRIYEKTLFKKNNHNVTG